MEPDKFIPLLEESALIIPLGRWIIDTAAKACNRWITNIPDFVMHINLSFVQIVKSNIIKDVLERIGRYSAANNHYVFEITETIEMDRIPAVERVFKEFIKNDFRLAIDDFGTGYSSLNLLKELPVDIIKIDKSFLDETESSETSKIIIRKTVELTQELDKTVVCEGVETENQADYLRGIRCDMAQGYLYAKPMPMEEFEKLLDKEIYG